MIQWVTAYLVDMPEFESDNPQHPMHALPKLHSWDRLHDAGKRLEANFNGPGFSWIAGPVDRVTGDVLRVCVEHCDYASVLAQQGNNDLALDSVEAIRSLAYKL